MTTASSTQPSTPAANLIGITITYRLGFNAETGADKAKTFAGKVDFRDNGYTVIVDDPAAFAAALPSITGDVLLDIYVT